MGFFSWNCAVSGISVKAASGSSTDVESDVAYLRSDGSVIFGHYDGYGRVGNLEVSEDMTGKRPGKFVLRAFYKPEIHKFETLGPSSYARDQGFFYDREFSSMAMRIILHLDVNFKKYDARLKDFESLKESGLKSALKVISNLTDGEIQENLDLIDALEDVAELNEYDFDEKDDTQNSRMKVTMGMLTPVLNENFSQIPLIACAGAVKLMCAFIRRTSLFMVSCAWIDDRPVDSVDWEKLLGCPPRAKSVEACRADDVDNSPDKIQFNAIIQMCIDKKIKPVDELTWRDWDLYEGVGAEEAAAFMNKTLMSALSQIGSRGAWACMESAMHERRMQGASDTEPRRLMKRYIDAMFESESS